MVKTRPIRWTHSQVAANSCQHPHPSKKIKEVFRGTSPCHPPSPRTHTHCTGLVLSYAFSQAKPHQKLPVLITSTEWTACDMSAQQTLNRQTYVDVGRGEEPNSILGHIPPHRHACDAVALLTSFLQGRSLIYCTRHQYWRHISAKRQPQK